MIFRRKKGQAAMEFLMTYGWAILIAIIAIAALIAFGVLNPPIQEVCGAEGVLVQGVSCGNVVATAGGTLSITITNNLLQPLTLTDISVDIRSGGATGETTCDFANPAAAIAGGGTTTIPSTNDCISTDAGAMFKGDLGFTYSTDSGTTTYPAQNIRIIKKIANA
jgi:hypothetical protein